MPYLKRIFNFLSSYRIVNSLKTALAVLIGYLFVIGASLPQSQWIVITIIVVMSAQTSVGSLLVKATMRFWGTVGGTILCIVVLYLFGNTTIATACALLISSLLFTYIAGSPGEASYAGTLGAVTVVIILLNQEVNITIACIRLVEILLRDIYRIFSI